MVDGTRQDEHDIAAILVRWGHARDADDWDTLAGCFHDDATIHISWIDAPAVEFIARSRELAAGRKAGSHTKHLIGGPWIEVNGERAFSRCHVNLYIRAEVGGHLLDLESWFRFFDKLEKRDGVWRIAARNAVYEKDRLDAVVPGSGGEGIIAGLDFSAFPPAAKYLCYLQTATGRPMPGPLISVYSPEEAALRQSCETWLSGG